MQPHAQASRQTATTRRAARLHWKRPLHLLHRWAGIILSPLFVIWFASGVVLAYVKFPQLTRPERLAAAPALDFSTAKLSPAQAAATLRAGDFHLRGTPTGNIELPAPADPAAPVQPRSIRLAQIRGRPAYVFTAGAAQPVVVFADDGSRNTPTTPAQTIDAARAFFEQGSANRRAAPQTAAPRHIETIQSDQWSVSPELHGHRPLLRVAMNDAAGTEYYVSITTGEVVRDTNRRERALNWLGSVPHWIYPHILRKYPDAWVWVVDILSVASVVVVLSGLAIGILRLRRRAFKPRCGHQRIVRWHYLAGIVFGAITLTWIFSGYISMSPPGFNPRVTLAPAEANLFAGCPLTPSLFNSVPDLPENTVEAALLHYDKQPLLLASNREGVETLLPANHGTEPVLPSAGAILPRVAGLMPGAPLVAAEILTGYDNHYYTRTPRQATHPLPVIRARFGDAQDTWFHIDPATGRVLGKRPRTARVFRHLYRGLHTLDWWWLWSRRPLWDIAIVGGSLGGLAISLTALFLALRRLAPRREIIPDSQ